MMTKVVEFVIDDVEFNSHYCYIGAFDSMAEIMAFLADNRKVGNTVLVSSITTVPFVVDFDDDKEKSRVVDFAMHRLFFGCPF